MADRALAGKSEQLALISRELNREIDSHVQRANAMEQRATILVGAASVVGALQLGSDASWATVANLALGFVAAVAGVVVVFPRRGDTLNIRAMRDDVLEMPVEVAEFKLADTKLEILEADERWLNRRGVVTRIGFVALSLSIAVALAAALT
ncbi:hypothetical protein FVA74_12620 [Salinibacterium sp. dk2585]|uniref:hypothetical protein n=1 Tax=unclassified Salinibacterium TaxID=2632331 RepID=UPI0011C245B9|nr:MULTISPECIES: hypothetical protein [unclassified Salinibacterium]QEE62326.1 hypothetical protein FVA74_12620 [Salinibacterium sp. dk2585]TXK53677.1 hypothetical protein FVP63_10890 [Salinibacterium sp. dk5596]